MIDVMGGEHSLEFATFRELTVRGFRAAQSLLPKIQLLVQMALEAHGGSFPCFSGGAAAVMDGLQQVNTQPTPEMDSVWQSVARPVSPACNYD